MQNTPPACSWENLKTSLSSSARATWGTEDPYSWDGILTIFCQENWIFVPVLYLDNILIHIFTATVEYWKYLQKALEIHIFSKVYSVYYILCILYTFLNRNLRQCRNRPERPRVFQSLEPLGLTPDTVLLVVASKKDHQFKVRYWSDCKFGEI